MTTVTVSPKYQVVIPASIRRQLNLQVGQKLEMLIYEGRIQLIPVSPIEDMLGFLPGLDTTVDREEEDRV